MRLRISSIVGTVAAAALGLAWAAAPVAAAYPEKTVTIVINWPPGGGSDRIFRLFAEYAPKHFGVSVVVVNKTGAGGANGTRAAAAAKPDGYTVGTISAGFLARQYTNRNANALEDIIPVAFVGPDPGSLQVRADTGIKTVADYVARAKADPKSLRNGNDQPGGSSYVTAKIVEKGLGIKMTLVPYKGYAPTTAALLSGEINSATLPVPEVIDHHKAGTVVLLAVASETRHFMAPDVPTFKELGHDVISGSWRLFFVPKGTPEDVRGVLERKLLATLADPGFVSRANKGGFAITPMGAAATLARMKADDAALYGVLEGAGLVKVRMKK